MKKTLREREIITLLPFQTWKSLLVLDMGEGIDMGLEGEAKLWILFLLVFGFCSFFKHLIISKTIGLKENDTERSKITSSCCDFNSNICLSLNFTSLSVSLSLVRFCFFWNKNDSCPSLSLSLKRTNLLSGWSCNDFPYSNGFLAGKKPIKTTTKKKR